MVNLRKTRQIELTDIHPQHVVCAWLGNSEDVAKKHYLKVTDGHMAAGSLLTASQKAGPKAGLSVTAMPSHAVSAKSQTLENKAYPVIDHHDLSQEMPEWAMRDSNRKDQKLLYIEATLEPVISQMARMQLSQAARRAITWKALFTPATRRRP